MSFCEQALWDCCHSQTVLDSSRPPDDPLDDPQDGFPGASSYGGSGGSDATEQSPDIPPSHPNHELTTLTTPMHELYTSGNESSNTLELRAHSLEETFQCMWGGPYGLHCNDLIRGHDLQSHLREAHRIHGSDKLRVECKWSYCSKVFNKQSLSRHVEETHMGIVHLCDCGKTFSRRDTLSKHKKRCPG
ncbi:hypothetical protein DFH29DRAFT_836482 [Suillus ampliporus]|nr:hypothetical protein DFH29DRAFT_836482 [Suillus ampliporus]